MENNNKMTAGKARTITGGLGFASKMPGTSFGLPASACKIGSILARVPGTTCHGCYALKGNYARSNVAKAHARRLAGIAHPLWVEAMVALLLWTHKGPIQVDLGQLGVRNQEAGGTRYFYNEPGWHRWHDSGDLQSVEHLRRICEVALRTPKIRHWLPTQELGVVNSFTAEGGKIPRNLVIRVSAVMVGNHRPRNWPHTSGVYAGSPPPVSRICPAPTQGHRCGSCRSCWSKKVAHVSYKKH